MSDQDTAAPVHDEETQAQAELPVDADTDSSTESHEAQDVDAAPSVDEDTDADPVSDATSDAEGDEGDAGTPRQGRLDRLEQEGDIAADYLEELLDIADLDGDLDMDVEGDRASVSIVGGDLNRLVGRNGEVLDALQELTRLAVLRETGERSRLMLDIGGHRAQRRTVLEGIAGDAIERVKSSQEPVSLEAMTPFERKVVHDAVAAAGLGSDSEGVEPRRYVVVRPV